MSYEFVGYGRLQLPFSVKIVLFNYDGGGRIAATAFCCSSRTFSNV